MDPADRRPLEERETRAVGPPAAAGWLVQVKVLKWVLEHSRVRARRLISISGNQGSDGSAAGDDA